MRPAAPAGVTLPVYQPSQPSTAKHGRGMQLSKRNDVFQVLDEVVSAPIAAPPLQASVYTTETVVVALEESLTATLTSDGAVSAYELKGKLTLRLMDEAARNTRISLCKDPKCNIRVCPPTQVRP